MARDIITALPALVKEASLKTEANALFTYSAEDEAQNYPNISTQTGTIRTIPPLI